MGDLRVRRTTLWRLGIIIVAALMLGVGLHVAAPRHASADQGSYQVQAMCGNGLCEAGEDVCNCSSDCSGVCSTTTGSTTGAGGPTAGTTDGTDATAGTTSTGGTTDSASPTTTTGGTTDSASPTSTTGGTTDSAAPTTTTDGSATTGAGDTAGAAGATDGSTTGGTTDSAAPGTTGSGDAGGTTTGGTTDGSATTGGSTTSGTTTAGTTTGGTNNSADPTSGMTNGSATGTTTSESAGGTTGTATTGGDSFGMERLDPRRPDGSVDPMHPTMLLVWVGIGIFAAVAIPAFMKNARKAKTAEATSGKAHYVGTANGGVWKTTDSPGTSPPGKPMDVAAPDPVQEHIKKAVLTVRKAGNEQQEYYKHEVDPKAPTDVANRTLQQPRPGGPQEIADGDDPAEGKVGQGHLILNNQGEPIDDHTVGGGSITDDPGGTEGPNKAGYNLKVNKKV